RLGRRLLRGLLARRGRLGLRLAAGLLGGGLEELALVRPRRPGQQALLRRRQALELLPVAGDLEDRGHRLRRRGPDTQPVLHPLGVDLDVRGILLGVVLAHRLDDLPVPLGPRVGHDDAVLRVTDLAQALQLDLDGHVCQILRTNRCDGRPDTTWGMRYRTARGTRRPAGRGSARTPSTRAAILPRVCPPRPNQSPRAPPRGTSRGGPGAGGQGFRPPQAPVWGNVGRGSATSGTQAGQGSPGSAQRLSARPAPAASRLETLRPRRMPSPMIAPGPAMSGAGPATEPPVRTTGRPQ